jgi:hypothetical protein
MTEAPKAEAEGEMQPEIDLPAKKPVGKGRGKKGAAP